MQAHTKMTSRSRGARWTGRVVSTLCVLFLLFDGLTRVAMESRLEGPQRNSVGWRLAKDRPTERSGYGCAIVGCETC
jgi:hypothetical protein